MPKTGESYVISREKRTFDIATALCIGCTTAPLMGIMAAALCAERGSGDVLLRQMRLGKQGATFSLLKLRTMAIQDYNGTCEIGGSHHPMASKLGKLVRGSGIDELPQVWNVLSGDLHMVGIRPQIPLTLEQRRSADSGLFDEWWEWAKINPGLFGNAQAYAHEVGSYHEDDPTVIPKVMRLDIKGCENASLANDIACIATAPRNVAEGIARHILPSLNTAV
jgi:lipopolysaccharide/colanic/teichoic acid biosynthesis glycosyltransferase